MTQEKKYERMPHCRFSEGKEKDIYHILAHVMNERTRWANKCTYTTELATDNADSLQTVSGRNSSRHQPARLIPNLIKTYLSAHEWWL